MKNISLLFFLLTFFFSLNIVGADGKSGWCISTTSKENYNGVTLANGRIGLVSGTELFSLAEIVLGGVYDKEYAGGVSKMVRAPKFTEIQLKIDGTVVDSSNTDDWKQTLNMREAYLHTSVIYKGTKITYTMRALRNLPYMTLTVIELTPNKDIDIEVSNSTFFHEEQQKTSSHFKMMRDMEAYMPVFVSEAHTLTGMHKLATCSSFIFDSNNWDNDFIRQVKGDEHSISFVKKLFKNKTYRFALVGAVCSTRDFVDPKSEAERMVVFALRNDMDKIIHGHKSCWDDLWTSDIIIEGCDEDQRDIRLALYHLYSFQRKGSRLSISPMGLSSSSGYNGHVFWDSELWMFPPVLLLNQDLARAHIDYRTDRLDKAIQRAEMFGYRGAMFPWESDDSGEESTPTWCLTGTFEHHITADIGIAFWNYYRVTKDKNWLASEGFPVMKAIADFWVSRVSKNHDSGYSIKNVVGANEYAHNVDDNAFTNGAAKVALQNAVKAAELLGVESDNRWKEVANGIKFHYMPDCTMKEHAHYEGEMIKQADVNLLAYPLGIVGNEEDIKRDLLYYEDKIDKINGPAMGNAILSVLYARMGDAKQAYRLFKKSYLPNKRPPFGLLSESPSSNNPYFATGAGGLLQAVLFGFAGLDLSDEGIERLSPCLPVEWKSLTVKGVGIDKQEIIIKH